VAVFVLVCEILGYIFYTFWANNTMCCMYLSTASTKKFHALVPKAF